MNPPPPLSDSTGSSTDLHTSLLHALQTRHALPASPTWVTNFLLSSSPTTTTNNTSNTTTNLPHFQNQHPPFLSLLSTAHFRLLHSDITTSLQPLPTSTFPLSLSSKQIKSTSIPHDVPAQVLDIEDVGASKWTQIEGIERVERGEEVKGREIVRVVPGLDEEAEGQESISGGGGGGGGRVPGSGSGGGKRSTGPHVLVLQDAAGMKVKVFEVGSVVDKKMFVTVAPEGGGMCIGCKVVVKKGTKVRRGVIMVGDASGGGGAEGGLVVLGGKVREWDEAWRKGRKERLKREMEVQGRREETSGG